jgi:hypothetical protein
VSFFSNLLRFLGRLIVIIAIVAAIVLICVLLWWALVPSATFLTAAGAGVLGTGLTGLGLTAVVAGITTLGAGIIGYVADPEYSARMWQKAAEGASSVAEGIAGLVTGVAVGVAKGVASAIGLGGLLLAAAIGYIVLNSSDGQTRQPTSAVRDEGDSDDVSL